ncbi:unnamed protein product, partial [Brenthis ino]
MCGIFCEIRYNKHTITTDNKVLERLRNRGPDSTNNFEFVVNNDITLYFSAYILWMQGMKLTPQPVEDENGILLFNGDIFDDTWDKKFSDTYVLMRKLVTCNSSEQIISQMKTLKGPFSLIYYNKLKNKLFFLRDRIGRNSLLFCKSSNSYVISSVLGRKYSCIEIPATYIYEFNINEQKLQLHSWNDSLELVNTLSIENWLQVIKEQQSQPDDEFIVDFDNTSSNLSEEDDVVQQIEKLSQKYENKLVILKHLLDNSIIFKTVMKIVELLEKSVKVRVETQPSKCKDCIKTEIKCNHCTTGILFSGGLDCTILAFLADKYVPKDQPIDLINVAFETKNNDSYDVPDRITGRESFEELKRTCGSRQWVFREVNVSRVKLAEYQSSIIGDLVYPRRTILDESLGSALWFAAQGQSDEDETSCRVLLLGSGADELFGGYVRHRNAFKRQGWPGLAKELLLDWKRISFRNLARDNRVISDHGRQPRLPYLDEDFTEFVLNLKPWLKCFPSSKLECGIGDKLILRLVAFYLGLNNVTILPKRALQFGSRIANKKEKGNDISKTFQDIKFI